MTPIDLSPEAIDRRLRDLGELYALGRSLATARLVESDANEERYAEAKVAFQARNYAVAFPVILERARTGEAHAQSLVGSYFQLGLTGPVDLVEAERWYLRRGERRRGRDQQHGHDVRASRRRGRRQSLVRRGSRAGIPVLAGLNSAAPAYYLVCTKGRPPLLR